MKIGLALFFTFVLVSAEYGNLETEWKNFKTKYNRVYPSQYEEAYRKQVFAENLKQIKDNNRMFELGQSPEKMEIAYFSDLTYEEFASTFANWKQTTKAPKLSEPELPPVPPALEKKHGCAMVKL